jgi:peptide-methionine (S)-S-oxide reductase
MYIDNLTKSGNYKRPIVTTLEPVAVWYPAEAYHQRYFQRNPTQPYVAHVVTPKVHKAREKFNEKLKSNIRD